MAEPDPLGDLKAALEASPRLRGVKVFLGSRELSRQTAIPRVVVVPTTFVFQQAELKENEFAEPDDDEQGNIADVDLLLEFRCWAANLKLLVLLLAAADLAVRDYRLGTETNIQRADGKFDIVEDTQKQGEAAISRYHLRVPIQFKPLDGGVGQVEAVQIEEAP